MAYNSIVNNIEEQITVSILGRFSVYVSFIYIIPIFIYISLRNKLIRQREQIEEAASGIDVQLKRRIDMLSKLIDTTKQYMKYEKETLTTIVDLRNQLVKTIGIQDVNKLNNTITDQIGKINVLLENYPNLKVNSTVIELQTGIKDCEDNIAAARRFYNSATREFNARIKTWPSNVAACDMLMHTYLYFEAAEGDRQNVKIDLT